jgi:hypothetical protein
LRPSRERVLPCRAHWQVVEACNQGLSLWDALDKEEGLKNRPENYVEDLAGAVVRSLEVVMAVLNEKGVDASEIARVVEVRPGCFQSFGSS